MSRLIYSYYTDAATGITPIIKRQDRSIFIYAASSYAQFQSDPRKSGNQYHVMGAYFNTRTNGVASNPMEYFATWNFECMGPSDIFVECTMSIGSIARLPAFAPTTRSTYRAPCKPHLRPQCNTKANYHTNPCAPITQVYHHFATPRSAKPNITVRMLKSAQLPTFPLQIFAFWRQITVSVSFLLQTVVIIHYTYVFLSYDPKRRIWVCVYIRSRGLFIR